MPSKDTAEAGFVGSAWFPWASMLDRWQERTQLREDAGCGPCVLSVTQTLRASPHVCMWLIAGPHLQSLLHPNIALWAVSASLLQKHCPDPVFGAPSGKRSFQTELPTPNLALQQSRETRESILFQWNPFAKPRTSCRAGSFPRNA